MVVTKSTNEDITIVVSTISVNDAVVDYTEVDWELQLWTTNSPLRIESRANEIINQGDISANAEIVDGNIEVYAKLSKTPLGAGQVKGQITLYIPNDSFEDGIQVVKSSEWKIGLTLT